MHEARQFLTLAEISDMTGVSTRQLRRLVRAGDLRAMKAGPRSTRVHWQDFESWVLKNTRGVS